jgi:hypothetical protein
MDLRSVLARLLGTNFRVPMALVDQLLTEDDTRRRQGGD